MLERLRIRVNRISMHDYEALYYHKEELKESCKYTIIVLDLLCLKKTARDLSISLPERWNLLLFITRCQDVTALSYPVPTHTYRGSIFR